VIDGGFIARSGRRLSAGEEAFWGSVVVAKSGRPLSVAEQQLSTAAKDIR
jgi:hypothetical protein